LSEVWYFKKKDLVLASFLTLMLILLGLVTSHIVGLAMAPEEAQLAPKQLKDDPEAYQVARGANIGVVRTWLSIGIVFSIVCVWVIFLIRYWVNKEDEEEQNGKV